MDVESLLCVSIVVLLRSNQESSKVTFLPVECEAFAIFELTSSEKGQKLAINWTTKRYSKQDFINAWNSSTSIAQVMRELGYAQGGGSYATMRKYAEELGLTSDHMLGNSHMKGKTHNWNSRHLEELLVKNSSAAGIKKRLFKEGILKKECSKCLITEWNGLPAPLELDHIDGDNSNNELSNLRILCPNCHAQTETYKGKNMKLRSPVNRCIDCGKEIGKLAKKCKSCSKSSFQKIDWPEIVELKKLVADQGYSKTGRSLGVSDNAVRKHIAKISSQKA